MSGDMARPLPERFGRASRYVSALYDCTDSTFGEEPCRASRWHGPDRRSRSPPGPLRTDRPRATDVLDFAKPCETSQRWSERTPRRDSSPGMYQGGPEPTLRALLWTSCKPTCAKSSRCSSKTENHSSNQSSWARRTSESHEMPSVPPLRAQQVITALTRLGFVEVRQRGSHKQFRHADGRGTTSPSIKDATLRQRSQLQRPSSAASVPVGSLGVGVDSELALSFSVKACAAITADMKNRPLRKCCGPC